MAKIVVFKRGYLYLILWIDALMPRLENPVGMKVFYKEESRTVSSIQELTPDNNSDFKLEATSIWSFPTRGNWASHKGDYRGNFAPQIPRNVIERYSVKGDTVLDPMVGSGTTLIEAKLTGRNGIGVDINQKPLEISKKRLEEIPNELTTSQSLFLGDARNLNKIQDNEIDLICTHPPYLNIIRYSENNPHDLSYTGSVKYFINEMVKIASECFRVLKGDKFLAILIGDTRKHRHYIPLSTYVLKTFLDAGFILREDIIKHQWNCKSTPLWRKQSMKYNFHMIMHEHLYIFRKPKINENITKLKYSSKNNGII